MFFPKLSQIATRSVITLSDDHSIHHAANLMDQQNLRDLVITGAQGLRMITARELVALRLENVDFAQSLAQVKLPPVNSLAENKNVIDGLQALKHASFEYLCLLDAEDKLSGIVSYSDMTAHLDPHYLSASKRIDDLVHLSNFVAVDADASLKTVLLTLQANHETAALVKQHDTFIGIVTQRDITHALAQQTASQTPISEIMSSPLTTIDSQATLQQALAFSREKRLKRLVVKQADGEVVGVLHQKDLVAMVYENWRNLLEEQQRHLDAEKELFKGGPVLLFIWRAETGWPVSFVSDNVANLLGYSLGEMKSVDFKFTSLIHPDDIQQVSEQVAAFVAERRPYWEQSYRLRLVNGDYRWFYVYVRPTYDANDQLQLIYGYLLDQTELLQAKNSAQQAQARLELTLDAAETGLWTWDMQTNLIDWSDQAFTQLGYAPQAFKVSLAVFQELVHPEDLQPMFDLIQAQMVRNRGFVVEFRVKNAQGDWTWVQGRGKVTKSDVQGVPIEMMGTHQDITDRKRAEAQLKAAQLEFQRSERLLEDGEDLAKIGGWEYQVETGQMFWTHGLFKLHEFTPSADFDHIAESVKCYLESDREKIMQAFQRCIENGEPYDMVFPFKTYLNNAKWIRTKTAPAFENGKVSKVIGIVADVTEQHLAEQQQLELVKQANAANQAKSEFLANMSHEIRTPLNGIIGLSELALQQNDPERLHDKLEKIYHSGRLLLGIINDVLDFSKIEAGKMEINPQPFYLCSLLENLKNLFEQSAQDKGLALFFDVDDAVKQTYIADEMRLRQILTNLIGNAIKFTSHGHVRLRVQVQPMPDNQAWLQFEIEDSGIGISPQQQQKLFQAFSQADNSITRQHGGTGLGLVISERLVKALGGSGIELESEVAKGSRFSFVLPMKRASSEQRVQPSASSLQLWQPGTQLSGHVLLVEDNEINQEVALEQLRRLGLKVTLAENGEQAVEWLKYQAIDLVLMDIQMPLMDGYQATRAIRQFNPSIPIIALTAAAMIEDKQKALAVGMNGHLSKPIESEALQKVLAEYLHPSTQANSKSDENKQAPAKTQVKYEGAIALINWRQGLAQLSGNQLLYEKLLQKFALQLATDYADLVPALSRLAQQKQADEKTWDKLQQQNHALKGVAGNLAVEALYQQSQQMDLLLKQQAAPTEQQAQAFGDIFVATQAALEQARANVDELIAPHAVNLSDLRLRLNALLARIQKSEFIDGQELQAIGDDIPQTEHQAWWLVCDGLDNFEFEQAAKALQTLINRLN